MSITIGKFSVSNQVVFDVACFAALIAACIFSCTR
jgi:hypothetical protein